MDWNITWLIIGTVSFILAITNLVRVVFLKRKGSNVLMFCSLSLGAFTVMEEYKVVGSWLEYENIVLLQSVPQLTTTLSIGLWILVIINLITLFIARDK